jgi:hypothetical protein
MALSVHGLPAQFESVSAVTLTPSVNLGETRMLNGEEYVYVYNDGGASMTVGYLAVMSGNTGFSVTVSSVSGFQLPIGFVKHATITTGAYGWLLTRGFTNVKNGMASTALAVGDPVFVAGSGTVQNYVQTAATYYSQLTAMYGMPIVGTVVQATGSAGTGYAYVRCWGT